MLSWWGLARFLYSGWLTGDCKIGSDGGGTEEFFILDVDVADDDDDGNDDDADLIEISLFSYKFTSAAMSHTIIIKRSQRGWGNALAESWAALDDASCQLHIQLNTLGGNILLFTQASGNTWERKREEMLQRCAFMRPVLLRQNSADATSDQ